MLHIPRFEIGPFINIARRRKWWVILPFFVTVLVGLGFLKVSPKFYKASTLVLLEPQSIPDSYVRATVTESFAGRIRTIQQQIQSRTNLEQVIKNYQLDGRRIAGWTDQAMALLKGYFPTLASRITPVVPDEKAAVAELVDNMRKAMKVEMRAGGSGAGGRDNSLAFEITLEWADREMIATIVNTLASRFIEQNLNAREERAVSTTDFLEKETAELKKELEAREKELESFKTSNMGVLPSQLESNIQILNQLQTQLQNLGSRLNQDKQQAMLLASQGQMDLQREPARIHEPSSTVRDSNVRHQRNETSEALTSGDLVQLETRLQRLRSQYTETHPDIQIVKRRIEALKTAGTQGASTAGLPREVVLQLVPINARINATEREIKEVESQIQKYKERVERTPEAEMAMSKLMRGHETVRLRYDSLLARKLDAKLAEEMERRQKGEQFRVLDSAVRPLMPIKPNPLRIILMALAGGLGLGCCLAYLREVLDARFYSPEELEAYLGTKVVVSLPTVKSEL